MLNSQKTRLFELVGAEGLDPAAFSVSETAMKDHSVVTIFRVRKSRVFFRAVAHPESWDHYACEWVTFSPAFTSDKPRSTTFVSFSVVATSFRAWLRQHAAPFLAEESARDPWSQLGQEETFPGLSLSPPVDDDVFTPTEQIALAEALARFRNLALAEFKLEERQLRMLDERLAYLSAAIPRVTRFDWKNLALSSLVTVVTALSLNSDQGRQLLSLFRQAFSAVAGLIP